MLNSCLALKGRWAMVMLLVVVAEAGSDKSMWLKQCDMDADIKADSRLIDGC
jgi:hypothetical protein